jgi:hypothetical protein
MKGDKLCTKRRRTRDIHGTSEGIFRCRIDEVKCFIKISIIIHVDLRNTYQNVIDRGQ